MTAHPTPQSYDGPDIPRPLGENLRVALGLAERPETFADWVDALFAVAARDDLAVGPDLLCTTEDSPYRAQFDGRVQHYQCVQDPIILPFLADDVDAVDIDTASPLDGEPVRLRVTTEGIDADPSAVIVSVGVAADVDPPPADGPSAITAYGNVCPYGHVFADREEYERWAETVDAHTMPTSIADTSELARAIGAAAADDGEAASGAGTARDVA
ncbi:MAG: organomercurial lyase [Halobacteriaceae archaeon]